MLPPKTKFRLHFLPLILVALLVSSTLVTSLGLYVPRAAAVTGSDFQAGNIIENGVFFNKSTMSSLDVQDFLNAKVPACDTNGSQIYSGNLTRAQYGATQGNSAPYTCLKDYRQDTPAMGAETGLCNNLTAGNRSAAQIIHDSASTCGINPQVLLVLLQKEQSLVTDNWPWPIQYTSATGFGCPDTAPCDNSVSGFFYQVYYAARQFKKYSRDANQYNYFANGNNNIQYSPNSSCSGSNVYIQNQATANLYIYTPYQPNQAALGNLYGSGDSCSAYGNRNFWRMFNDWFGSTHASPFAWQPISQESFSDVNHTLSVNPNILSPNTTYYFRLHAQNLGNSTWHNSGGSTNNQVNLGTVNPKNRTSNLATNTWINPSRPATLLETSVAPSDIGTFEFSMTTPATYNTQIEYFNLVAEGQTWMTDLGLYWPIAVGPPTPLWTATQQTAYYDAAMSKPLNQNLLAPNTTYYMSVKALNVGNTNWTNSGVNPTQFGTSSAQDRASAFYDSSWFSPNRPTTLKESSVAPGQNGTFNFAIHTPSTYGTYKEYFRPVVAGQAWMNDIGFYYQLDVAPPTNDWSIVNQNLYTNSSKTMQFQTNSTPNATHFYASVTIRNIGNTTWTNGGVNPLHLGTSNPKNRSSLFYDSSWLGPNRPANLSEASVAPGDTGTFNYWLQAPYATNGTTYKEYFQPVVEGQSWLPDKGMYYGATMQSGNSLPWKLVSQTSYSDSALKQPIDTSQLSTNSVYYLQLKVRNLSGVTWSNNNFKLGTSNPRDRTSVFAYNWPAPNRASSLTEPFVAPGDNGTFTFAIKTPLQPVNTNEYFDPLIEGNQWLPDIGLYYPIISR